MLPLPLISDRTSRTTPLLMPSATTFTLHGGEVPPHLPDAWVDYDKTKVGYEIPINRYFYVYEPPRPLGGD